MRIGKIILNVKNQEEAVKFWTEQVGFELVTDFKIENNNEWIEVKSVYDDTTIVLLEQNLNENENQQIQVCAPQIEFITDDIDRIHYHLEENGVLVSKVRELPNAYLLTFTDNEANNFDVRQNKKINKST